MKKICFFLIFLYCGCLLGISQTRFVLQNDKKFEKVPFKLINNLIIIPVEINDVSLSFILDTGVSKPIVFSFLHEQDTLQIYNSEAFFLRGLGEGESYEASKSTNNIFKVGNAISLNQDMYAIHDANLNFTSQLGVPVHGIIGFDLFKDFIVEINYSSKHLKLHDPKYYKYKNCKKCETINLEFYNNKPYLNAEVSVNDTKIPVKLLIDSGGSDALWLFEDDDLGLYEGERYFNDFLGKGLSGSVYGKRAKIERLHLKSFTLKAVNVAYPDSLTVAIAKRFKDRNGSVSGQVLKRFNMVVDYRGARLTLKKNKFFKDDFNYNKSGIEIEHRGELMIKEDVTYSLNALSNRDVNDEARLTPTYKYLIKPAFVIVELRAGSPAAEAGLLKGDVVLQVNKKDTYKFKLQEVVRLFYEKEGDEVTVLVDRNGSVREYRFRLRSPLK